MQTWLIWSIPLFLFILFLLAAIYSFAEMALSSSSKIKLKSYLKDGSNNKFIIHGAKLALRNLDLYNESLTSIVVANNIFNILLATISAVWFGYVFSENVILGTLLSFIIVTIIIIIFGEIIPKMFAKKYSEIGSIYTAPLVNVTRLSLYPITWIFKKIVKQDAYSIITNEEELKEVINEAEKIGVASKNEKDIINSVLKMDQTNIEKIMIKKEDVVCLKSDSTDNKIKSTFLKNMVSRIPIVDEEENVVGILNANKYLTNQLIKGGKNSNITAFTYEFQIFNTKTTIHNVFYDLKNKRQKMGIIVDDNDKFVGIITIEDILESIVGQIYDEEDIGLEGIYIISKNNILVKPNVNVDKLFTYYLPEIKKPSNITNKTKFVSWFRKEAKIKKMDLNIQVIYQNLIIWIKEDKHLKDEIIFEIDVITDDREENKNETKELIENN